MIRPEPAQSLEIVIGYDSQKARPLLRTRNMQQSNVLILAADPDADLAELEHLAQRIYPDAPTGCRSNSR
jgi:hypothetical protein